VHWKPGEWVHWHLKLRGLEGEGQVLVRGELLENLMPQQVSRLTSGRYQALSSPQQRSALEEGEEELV
jgi:hypothetical protein